MMLPVKNLILLLWSNSLKFSSNNLRCRLDYSKLKIDMVRAPAFGAKGIEVYSEEAPISPSRLIAFATVSLNSGSRFGESICSWITPILIPSISPVRAFR